MPFASVLVLPAWLPGLPGMALIIVATTATTAAFASATATAGASTATTAAEASSAASATKAAPTASAGTVRLRLGFIDLQCASTQFGAIQGGNGLLGFACVGHFHKRKAAGAAGFPVGDHADFLDCSMGLKKAA